MKRFVLLSLVVVLAVSVLIGCTPKEPPAPPPPPKVYVEGTFAAVSDANARGYVSAEITIKDDKITEVKLAEYAGLGLEKPADYAWPQYHQAMAELPGKFVAANGTKVDTISGATSTTTKAKQAVERAMEKAMVIPPSTAAYHAGTFMGVSDADARGGWTVVLVTIDGQMKISEVVINSTRKVTEKNAEGVEITKTVFKDETYAWPQYHEALKVLPERMIAANKTEVDIVTGATGTSNQAKQAAARALELAKRR
jgi:uncharacterized protein with FMN-binding domain